MINNYDNSRVQFIRTLRDTSEKFTKVNIEENTFAPLYYLNGKPVFDEDPKKNREIEKEYKKWKKKNE